MARYVLRQKSTGKFAVGHGNWCSFSGESLDEAKVYRTKNGGPYCPKTIYDYDTMKYVPNPEREDREWLLVGLHILGEA